MLRFNSEEDAIKFFMEIRRFHGMEQTFEAEDFRQWVENLDVSWLDEDIAEWIKNDCK